LVNNRRKYDETREDFYLATVFGVVYFENISASHSYNW